MLTRAAESDRGFNHEGVDEGLGKIATHLLLGLVVFLTEESRWAAGGAGPFVPADGEKFVALLVGGEGHEKSAEQEGAFGVGERLVILAEAVGVAVFGEVAGVGGERSDGARVLRGNGAT